MDPARPETRGHGLRPGGPLKGDPVPADLRYKMIMALNAADLGSPLCEAAAAVCAEVAERHYLETRSCAPVSAEGAEQRQRHEERHPEGTPLTDVTVVDVSDDVIAGSAEPHITVREEHLA
jgi:hypothetical protein